MGLVGNGWANCFRTHNELTLGLPGKYPLAPSVNQIKEKIAVMLLNKYVTSRASVFYMKYVAKRIKDWTLKSIFEGVV